MYDAELGRFHTVDPLAEIYSFQSQYVYAGNNPISYIDYNGEEPVLVIAGVTVGLVELGLLATGVITTGWILSKNSSGEITINKNLFAKNRISDRDRTYNYRASQKTTTRKPRKPKFDVMIGGMALTSAGLYYFIEHKQGTNVGHHEFKMENYGRYYFDGNIDFSNMYFGKPFFKLNDTNLIIKTPFNPEGPEEKTEVKRLNPSLMPKPKPTSPLPLPKPDILPDIPVEPPLPPQNPLPKPRLR